MTKPELAALVAARTGLTKKDTMLILNTALDTIAATVAAGEKVQLVGFGAFEAKLRQSRPARNPKTGEEIEIPAAKVPTFKCGKLLKSAVNNEN